MIVPADLYLSYSSSFKPIRTSVVSSSVHSWLLELYQTSKGYLHLLRKLCQYQNKIWTCYFFSRRNQMSDFLNIISYLQVKHLQLE